MHYKMKLSPAITVTISVAVGIVLQLSWCALYAVMAGKGIVAEDKVSVFAAVVSGFTTAILVLFTWLIAPKDRGLLAGIGVGSILALQVASGLLFWGIGWNVSLINTTVVVAVYFAVVFILSRQKRSVWTGKRKKSFC